MQGHAPFHAWRVGPGLAGLIWLAAAATLAEGGEIYKSIDSNGHVVYSDHADPAAAQTSVVHLEDSRYPPDEMHVCGTQDCFTLSLDNGIYRRVDGSDDTWTIESFTSTAVVLRRHGAATGNADVMYSGGVANDRLINVKVDGNPTSGLDASWGIALNTLPGTNAERDANELAIASAPAAGAVSTSATPPPLPVEDQPEIPETGDLWTPGYWYWRDQGYFWVPGGWVHPPQTGFLWTPAFWALVGTGFVFHPGHWGPTVGFYGGIDYGHGYFGSGYSGGRWVAGTFSYNSSVNHLSPAIKNTYSEAPPSPVARNFAGFNPGHGTVSTVSTSARPPAAPTAAVQNARPAARQMANPTLTANRTVVVTTSVPNRQPPAAAGVPAPPKINHPRQIKPTAPRN